MPTQTIDMNNVTSVTFNNQTVNGIKLNGTSIWTRAHNTYFKVIDTFSQQFTLSTNNNAKNWDGTIEYSTDLNTWTIWDGTSAISSSNNGTLYLRGKNNTYLTGGNSSSVSKYWVFSGEHAKSVSGQNIENLLDNEIVGAGMHPTMASYAFAYLFANSTNIPVSPDLPATTLAQNCYNRMFYGCTALTTAPNLPATTLANNCYNGMFYGCTALTTAPNLPATTLANSCYNGMFSRCTALTTAPNLPATTLAQSCYGNMFSGCTALTTAPNLPATTLANNCYRDMFNGCTALTTLPALPATTLFPYCYYNMFYGCKNIKLSTTSEGIYVNEYRIPPKETGTTANNALTKMFTNTGGTFADTPTVNITYYTSNTIVP